MAHAIVPLSTERPAVPKQAIAPSRPAFRTHPLSRAIGLLLLAGGGMDAALAQQAFSSAWFANKAAVQGAVGSTGRLPNGAPAPLRPTGPQQQSQAARDRLQQSINNLGVAAQAIALRQALQQQARQAALARPSDVPDGLGEGGLKIDEDALTRGWHNAKDPTQQVADGKTTVTIEQTGSKAILNWETFNVGRNTTVKYDQQADWAVLNRVNDPLARPSQIQGQIEGAGTVLVLNRNGVVFDGSSQVNVRNLVAAAAQMSDTQFLGNGLYGANGAPSFTDAGGAVKVEAGALIRTREPQSVTQGGGYVLLLGGEVDNAGQILTRKGQTQLAAGDSFVIRKGAGTEGNQASTTRGNEVAALRDAASTHTGRVVNTGLIQAREGDVTLAGHDVRQEGVAIATTTVNARGTVHLLNSAGDAEGSVTLGEGALTAVLLEDDGKTTALDSQRDALIAESEKLDALRMQTDPGAFDNYSRLSDRRDQSRVEIVSGGDVNFKGDSLTLATGGQIAVTAGNRAQAEAGARLDVSGAVGVKVAMESNTVQVNVQGNELRDSPHNRDGGKLLNSTIWVDRRDLVLVPAGTGGYASDRWYAAGGLLEVSGWLNNQGHGIGEWAAQGGTITLGGKEVITRAGSQINLSGGALDVQTGYVQQTWLRDGEGRLHTLQDAPTELIYAGVYQGYEVDHERWGVQDAYLNPIIAPRQRLENGYTVGRDAGRLIVDAPTVVLEGDIEAKVFEGERQTRARDAVDGYRQAQSAVARSGELIIGRVNTRGFDAPHASRVVIGDFDDVATGGPDAALPEDRIGTVLLDADRLNRSGLGGLTLTSADAIHINADLSLADGGVLDLSAAEIAINADVTARSGNVRADNVVEVATVAEPASTFLLREDGSADFTLGTGATLDLSGTWHNGLLDGAGAVSLAHIDGGALSVRMVAGSIRLEQDSRVDLRSGAALHGDGKLSGGRGGDLSLIANDDRVAVTGEGVLDRPGRELVLDGEILAAGMAGGGTLTLQAPTPVVFGTDAVLESGVLEPGTRLPADVVLGEAVTIGIGGRLPVDASASVTTVVPDRPLPAVTVDTGTQPEVVLAGEWTVPENVWVNVDGNWLTGGTVLPAGTRMQFLANTTIPAGTVFPSSVFPQGFAVFPYVLTMQAGEIAPVAVTVPAGQLLPRGTWFDQAIAFDPALKLDAGLLRSGFADYRIGSRAGLVVSEGTELAAEMPLLRPTADAFLRPSDSALSEVLAAWTPPVVAEDPTAGRLRLRAGADVSLHGASLEVGEGAHIRVDPGHRVCLAAARQLVMDGTITAPGGEISLLSAPIGVSGNLAAGGTGVSLWVGENGVLDVAGRAWTARDAAGRRYGLAQDGGAIRIGLEEYGINVKDVPDTSRAMVVIREGARLDASGAAATVDLAEGLPALARPITLAGDGGLIQLGSQAGILNDGELRASAGGAGAAGGQLNLILENREGNGHEGVRTLTVSQARVRSGLADDAMAGDAFAPEDYLGARISAEQIEAGGFGTLDLWSRDVISFEGDVDLALSQRLALRRGLLSVAEGTPEARVTLSAPHVLLVGKVDIPVTAPDVPKPGLVNTIGSAYRDYSPGSRNDAALTIQANLIDVRDAVQFGGAGQVFLETAPNSWTPEAVDRFGFDQVNLVSQGDLRFGDGLLYTGGDLNLTARQIYPTTHASAEVAAGVSFDNTGKHFDPGRTLTIRGLGDTPEAPFSVFGSLALRAANIDQGGVVRAPLGRIVFGGTPDPDTFLADQQFHVLLREGSLTSTSAAGLRMPYGGTADGLRYLYNGQVVEFDDLAALDGDGNDSASSGTVDAIERGVLMGQVTLTAEAGSVIDVSGGGELTGAGFFTGRGGSVDILRTPLANANPANGFSDPDAEVYAIVPSMPGQYAPVSPDAGAGAPRVGQQITLTEAVGGLPAGTYTLMPSTYALLPGAFRVELAGGASREAAAVTMPGGTFRASAYLGIANTNVRDVLPTTVTLMSGETVRRFSQYNETSYADFAIAEAARFGTRRPRLERDAQSLHLDFARAVGEAMDFKGQVRMAGEDDGADGNLFLTSLGALEIKQAGQAATEGFSSVNSEDLAGIQAGILTVGGTFSLVEATAAPSQGSFALGPRVVFESGKGTVAVRDGAQLRADQVFLTSGEQVLVEGGATLEARATDGLLLDSSRGYVFSDSANGEQAIGGAVLAVSAGDVRFTPPTGANADAGINPNAIRIGDGAVLRSPGTLAFSTNGELALGDAQYNARYFALTAPSLHIGTDAAFARAEEAGAIGDGVRLSQTLLERLIHPSAGQQAVERVSLSAGNSINLFGEVDFDLGRASGDADTQLWLETPALYGWGEADETARIAAGTVVWNGLASGLGTPASPYVSAAPGAVVAGGAGTGAGRLSIEAERIEFGYAPYARGQDQVELDRLALGFAGVDLRASERITANHRGTLSVYASGTDADSYAGGDLHLSTPVLTGAAGSFMAYRTGGALTVDAPAGAPAYDRAGFNELGAEVRLSGQRVNVDTAVALPSGRLVLEAEDGIALGERSMLDLAGRTLNFFDAQRHSWGGDLVMEAENGAITQAAGSRIDVSAQGNDAGTIRITATGAEGRVALDGQLFGGSDGAYLSGGIDVRAHVLPDFAGLNARLNTGGFFEARGFSIGTGDLVIGDEVRARQVSIAANGGSLTVNGRIDASGAQPGDIRLAARADLVLASTAMLDAHGTQLQLDGHGAVIDASNRGHVELTSAAGRVSLEDGARIDLGTPDGIARGQLDINAPRLGADDVAVDAASGVDIRGAASIAVNAFRGYVAEDGTVDQARLDAIHADSVAFIDAALGNEALAARLQGLSSHGDAFHLRPGVEIRSGTAEGDLTVTGDIDFSGYRYGPDADPALRGSGEPGVVVLRAGGDLRVNGSISDGFAPPPVTPDDDGFSRLRMLLAGGQATEGEISFEAPFNPDFGDFWFLFPGAMTGADLPVVESGWVTDGLGAYYGPGDQIPGMLYGTITLGAGTRLTAVDPVNADIALQEQVERRNWAAAPMLEGGMQSWSMRLVGGADLAAADSRTLAAASRLGGRGDVILDGPGKVGPLRQQSALSVIRTGTGDLEVLAGGDYVQKSLFGVYTAGTQVAGAEAWDQERARLADGTVLGVGNEAYEATLAARRMYFTTGGGDLQLSAQGDVRGFTEMTQNTSGDIGNWLWRQGGEELGQPTAWGVNFGQYVYNPNSFALEFAGFAGIGSLGGGNVSVSAGEDMGSTVNSTGSLTSNDALSIVVGSSGRVEAQGRVLQDGGGRLSVSAGGRINTGLNDPATTLVTGAVTGLVANLRGDASVRAGAIGQSLVNGYGVNRTGDPRAVDVQMPSTYFDYSPLTVAVGDGRMQVNTRGGMQVTTGTDAGRVALNGGATRVAGETGDGSAVASFSLWTEHSGLELFAAGGNLLQSNAALATNEFVVQYDAGRFSATAAGGSLVLERLLLAPSHEGSLDLLARDHVIGRAAMSSAAPDGMATPDRPLWVLDMQGLITSNAREGAEASLDGGTLYNSTSGALLFAFAPDTASDLHQGKAPSFRIYALTGDIDADIGRIHQSLDHTRTYYVAAGPARLRAGRDILAGSHVLLNNDANDVSLVRAGRDILNTSFRIAGPGLLDVAAGRNIYQTSVDDPVSNLPDLNLGVFRSLGPVVVGDDRPGAGIVLSAGMGAKGPDLEGFAARYLDPANLADPARPLADQPDKVVRTYERELVDWLRERFAYEGDAAGALAWFQALPVEQRGIFLRQVYFEELRLAGREYNNPDSRRFQSYLRGRDAIASFLPGMAEGDDPGSYQGSIVFSEGAGAHTDFGGGIQVLAPGGGLTLGVDGVSPPPTTGLLTQGNGDIEAFTRDSVLLGLSRVFTTFGGGITLWSARGDINAGRGAKTTVVYTPPRVVYDDLGNVSLSPQVPSSGAGIATLNPIPEVAPGDIDLIAPLGTIDAGEAGIRVSGNVNLAALRVVNADNIQVQGKATGLQTAAAVNVAALSTASAAATNAVQAAQDTVRRQAQQSRPSIISVQVLGFGDSPGSSVPSPRVSPGAVTQTGYDPGNAFQVLGNGALGEAQRARLNTAERSRLDQP
ncbi:filamentous haemagglutinin family protein [Pseudoxanthomonas sp. z9]|uniref:filamentous haemagglutinin family protein n=1 Tax=Pseudoxanthomonas sp. z9 TaxID=2584942 RepID=UPI001142EB98|nr:filamentous haemagglutinin family protein [Pseudoxanthomonas sp. z9]